MEGEQTEADDTEERGDAVGEGHGIGCMRKPGGRREETGLGLFVSGWDMIGCGRSVGEGSQEWRIGPPEQKQPRGFAWTEGTFTRDGI